MGSALTAMAAVLADLVFPRLCGCCGERVFAADTVLCPACGKRIEPLLLPLCPLCGRENAPAGSRCDDCPRGQAHFEAARAATVYGGAAKTVVEKLKYHGRAEYARLMARHMMDAWRQLLLPLGSVDAIVPVPLHPVRRRQRGFNQAELLARELASSTGIGLATAALRRIRPTPSQTRLGRQDRARNVEGAFETAAPLPPGTRRVLLVDDVYTTGATLNECARALRAQPDPPAVVCLSFARARMGQS